MSHSRHSKRHWRELWSKRASFAGVVGWLRGRFPKTVTHRIERRAAKQAIENSINENQ